MKADGKTGELELFFPTVRSSNTAFLTMETTKEEAGWSFQPGMSLSIIACSVWGEELAGAI